MPERVKGKLYTPTSKGVFLVAFKHDDMVVTLLFELRSLYFTAFHARGVWYCLSECDISELPLQAKKIVQLSITCSYANIGGTKIRFSKMEFINCVSELWKAGVYLDLGVILQKIMLGSTLLLGDLSSRSPAISSTPKLDEGNNSEEEVLSSSPGEVHQILYELGHLL